HRIPLTQKAAEPSARARAGGEEDQGDDQRVRGEQPRPTGNTVAAKAVEQGAAGHRDIGQRRDVDRGETAPRLSQIHPASRYHCAARCSPSSSLISARQPVSRVSASLVQVHAGARYSLPLSGDNSVDRPMIRAMPPTVNSNPRATSGGTPMMRGVFPSARPQASASSRLVTG